MPSAASCACGSRPRLVFACSGAADVGAVADAAARKLTSDGVAKMFCLAGVGGRVPGILKTVEAAGAVIAIDGCPLDCAAKTLEQAGFSGFSHVRLSELGMEKGDAPANAANVEAVVRAVAALAPGAPA